MLHPLQNRGVHRPLDPNTWEWFSISAIPSRFYSHSGTRTPLYPWWSPVSLFSWLPFSTRDLSFIENGLRRENDWRVVLLTDVLSDPHDRIIMKARCLDWTHYHIFQQCPPTTNRAAEALQSGVHECTCIRPSCTCSTFWFHSCWCWYSWLAIYGFALLSCLVQVLDILYSLWKIIVWQSIAPE